MTRVCYGFDESIHYQEIHLAFSLLKFACISEDDMNAPSFGEESSKGHRKTKDKRTQTYLEWKQLSSSLKNAHLPIILWSVFWFLVCVWHLWTYFAYSCSWYYVIFSIHKQDCNMAYPTSKKDYIVDIWRWQFYHPYM